MSQTRVCPDCGAEIPADSPAGQCPRCLLKEGFRSGVSSQHSLDATAPSPASSGFEPPPIEQLAPLFPQLELLELIGKGGMGAVYKARQTGLDRLVAVKILPPEVGRDPAFAERFTREARAMARLSHPHIVAIYDFGHSNGQFYFVMEFIDGANLRQVIQSKQLTPAEALAVVPQICDALQYAHDEGIVHRDIKPENILVDKRGRVKIADFGLSKLLHEQHADVSLTGTHQVMGTLRYMAPEQMEGTKSVDHRADIYSLGVVFYELLTGQAPMGRFDPPSKKVQVDVRLDEVVLRALEQEPEKRYQQASEVKRDVESVRTTSPVPIGNRDSGKAALPRPLRFHLWVAVVGLSLVATLGLALASVGFSAMFITWVSASIHGTTEFVPNARSIISLSCMLVAAGVVASAAGHLRHLRNHEWCFVGSVVSMLLGGLIVGVRQHVEFYLAILPGLHALWLLQKAEIRDAFRAEGVRPEVGKHSPPASGPAAARRGAGLAELAAICVGLGILVSILLYVFTQDLMLTSMALMGGQALAVLLGLLSYRRALGRYSMLVAVVVLGGYSGMQFLVNDGQMPILGYEGTVATIQGETGPDTAGLDQGLVRYRVNAPPDHKVIFWVEYYVKGEKRKLRDFTQTVWRVPRPGEGVSELFELRLQDGHKFSPKGKDKLRWDWNAGGGWMPSPFVGMDTVSWSGPPDRRWRLAPGEDAMLWAIRGGKGDWSSSLYWGSPAGGIMAEAKDSDAFLVLKARIEPVTEAERRAAPAGGLGVEGDAYVPVSAGGPVAAPSPSSKQDRVTTETGRLEAPSVTAEVTYFEGHTADVQDVAVTSDDRTIISVGSDGKIIARDLSGKILSAAVSPVAEKSPSTAWLTSVAVTSSGSDAYAGDAKGIWHVKIGDSGPPRRLLNSADTVQFVSLYGGNKLAYVDNTEIKYHDLQNKKDLAGVPLRPEKVTGYVRGAAASPSGRHIAVNSVEKDGDGVETYKLSVYDALDMGALKLVSLYLSYAEFYHALPVFLDDRTLVVCLPEGRMRRWTFADDRWQLDPTTVRVPLGFTAAAVSRDDKIIYLALPNSSPGDKQRIVGLDAATGKTVVAADLQVGPQLGNNISWWINALATTDEPHQVVAALWDGRVAVVKCVPFAGAPPVAAGPASMIADKSQLPTVGQPGREDFAFVFKAPPGHVLTVWLESWENGKLTIPPECCERFASGKAKPLDVTLRLATQEGRVVNPDLSGKLRFDWALGEGNTDLSAARSVWLKSPEEPFAPQSAEKPWKGGATTYRNHYIAGPPTNPLDACRVKVGTTKRLYSLTSYDQSKATEDQKKRGEVLSIPDLMDAWPTAAIFVRARIDVAGSFPGNMYARESHRQLNLGDRRFTSALIRLTRLAQDLGAEVQDATDESEVRLALVARLEASDAAREQALALLKTKNILADASASADALAEMLRESVASKASPGPDTKADYESLARGTWRLRFNVPADVDGPAGTLKDGVIIMRDFLMDRAEKSVFFRDGIVRAKVEGFGSVHLRCTGDSYQLALMQDGLHIYKWQKDMPVKLASISPEALTKSEGFRELTFVALGSHLIGYLDGKRTIELIDRSIAGEGVVAIHAHRPPDKFKDVEVMSLDGVDVQDAIGGLAVLNQFVGTWNLEQTARPAQKHPDHTITNGKVATRWVLGGRYLRSDYELGSNPGPIVLATYDPQRDEYPTWVFIPSGSVVEVPRKWSPADLTLCGNIVDEETGIAVRCNDVLHTERSITRTLLVTNKHGRKIHDVSDRLLRAGDADLAAEPGETATGPDADVPQLKVLAPLAGGFATESGMTDAAGKRHPSPAGRNQTRWIMRGRMLEERGLTPDGAADTHLCFWTYDTDDEKYHHWFLPIFGSPASVTFEWDETARALDGRGTFQTGEKTTSRVQLADPDRIQWTMTSEASGGRDLRFDGRLTRIKN